MTKFHMVAMYCSMLKSVAALHVCTYQHTLAPSPGHAQLKVKLHSPLSELYHTQKPGCEHRPSEMICLQVSPRPRHN